MAEYTAYFNGAWMPLSQVKVSHSDRGLMKGDYIYDVARTFNGKSWRMQYHVDRLYRSLKYARIDPGLTPGEMLEISEEAIRRNEHFRANAGDYQIRQFVTRGSGRTTATAGPATVCVKVEGIDFGRYARFYKVGTHGVIARTRSYSANAMEPKLKHASRMNFNLADLEAADVDPDAWAIVTDNDGNLTEGTEYNVALVTRGVIRTPTDRSLLQGQARNMVFELARQLGISIVEEDLQPYDLYTADEAFFMNTVMCVLPVTRTDNRTLGNGKPGPITQQLLAAWSERVGLDIADQATQFAR